VRRYFERPTRRISAEHQLPVSVAGASPAAPALALALAQNAPNPFNPLTMIRFSIPNGTGRASLGVYDTGGRRVRSLVDGPIATGDHAIEWNGADDAGGPLPSGTYLYRLETEREVLTRHMVLVK
jgi:hypothetical protein